MGPLEPQTTQDADRRRLQRTAVGHWLALAIASLVVAGLLSAILVVGRVPGLDRLFPDPLFFRRGLVVHVVLAIVVWFYAFGAGLYLLLPSRREPGRIATWSPALAAAGVAVLVLASGISGAPPVLANYVPVIDHPLFLAGLLAFGLGLLATLLRPVLLPDNEAASGFVEVPAAARPGLRAIAIAILLAMITFYAAWTRTPTELPAEAYYEIVMWGGGHVLQFASVAAMLSVWIILLTSLTGAEPVSRRTSSLLFGLLIAPLFAAPILALGETTGATYRLGFTRLMELGIFPVVTVFLVLSIRSLVGARRRGVALRFSDPRLGGFVVSAGLTVIGFALGLRIDGSNTLVPAHYHAAIGAVTVSFMAVTFLLLEPLGVPLRSRRARRLAGLQPALFGVGQMVFAVGFGVAGAYGMLRKTYAQEQQVDHIAQAVGLTVMGVGGLLAVAGGLLFLGLVVHAWRSHRRPLARETNATKLTPQPGADR